MSGDARKGDFNDVLLGQRLPSSYCLCVLLLLQGVFVIGLDYSQVILLLEQLRWNHLRSERSKGSKRPLAADRF